MRRSAAGGGGQRRQEGSARDVAPTLSDKPTDLSARVEPQRRDARATPRPGPRAPNRAACTRFEAPSKAFAAREGGQECGTSVDGPEKPSAAANRAGSALEGLETNAANFTGADCAA